MKITRLGVFAVLTIFIIVALGEHGLPGARDLILSVLGLWLLWTLLAPLR